MGTLYNKIKLYFFIIFFFINNNLFFFYLQNNAITCSPTLTSETLNTHYQDFKREIETDVKQLNEQRQIKALEATRLALEKKMQKNAKDNEELLKKITLEEEKLQINEDKLEELKKEIAVCKNIEDKTDEM